MTRTSLIVLLLLGLLSCATAYNYLFILHTLARSHNNVGSALAKGLALAGHQVTLVSAFPQKKPLKNLTDVIIKGMLPVGGKKYLLDLAKMPIMQQIIYLYGMGIDRTKTVLTEPTVEELKKTNQTFDAVLCEVFFNEAHFGFAEHFNAPLIGISTFGAITWNADMVGTPSPPSYVPHAFLKFSDQMSLWERVGNLAFLTYEQIYLNLYYLPKQEQLYKKYFPNNKLNFNDMRKNAALVLLNQHVSLSFPRPYNPNMIEVGGMHINRKRQPLPADIEYFINGAKHGVIYFSMGSNVNSNSLPPETRAELLKALGSLKQRVLWKFEDSNLPDKPANVFISDWFPQDDILAHEKVIAFITHGGLLSTTESIYHGKPFVGIPVFGDQFLNMAHAEQNGYGISVKFSELTAEKLVSAVNRLVSDPKATEIVRAMSERYRDQQSTPLERAIYWVEHVSRTKGAKYLRSAGQDFNFIQYHNLDAIFILYGGILFVLYCIVMFVRFVCRKVKNLFSGKKQQKKQQKKKQKKQ